MLRLYRFFWDCGRMGQIESLFFATEEQIIELLGKEVYLDDVLGKHSEIFGTVEREDLEEIVLSENTLQELSSVFENHICGYNPLDYIQNVDSD